ncbi:helicase ARIP4-like [Ornithodoros turicata]|uniref:helicase ARIP4-like n=1 Tax=Ornithodoros turicata TaxID=34597 RepID=UPI003138E07A
MFPGFTNSVPSPRGSQGTGPWFPEPPFPVGRSEPEAQNHPYWLPHQYPRGGRYQSPELYSSTGPNPWWFGHPSSARQYFPHSFPERSNYFEPAQQQQQQQQQQHFPMATEQAVGSQDTTNQHFVPSNPDVSSYSLAPTQHTVSYSGGGNFPVNGLQDMQGYPPFNQEHVPYNVPQGAPVQGSTQRFSQVNKVADTAVEENSGWQQPQFVPPSNEPKEQAPKVEEQGDKKPKGKRKREEAKKKPDAPPDPLKRLQRKNIRDIKDDKELDVVTLNAQKEEQERMRRLQEARLRALQQQVTRMPSSGSSSSSEETTTDSSEEEDEEPTVPLREIAESRVVRELKTRAQQDVIDISSDESKALGDDDDDDDDVVIVGSDEEAENEQENNIEDESHMNDAINMPDEQGRVLVNVGHPPEEPDVFLAPQLAGIVKPHQIGGIRFLFDNVVESLDRFDTSSGFGCILAHSMGLGKTLQVISFVDVLLRHTAARKVLCISPINTIQNWMAEFDKWVPAPEALAHGSGIRPRSYNVYVLNDLYRTTTARAELILDWHKKGGALLMGYEMYRMLALKKTIKPNKRRRSPKKEEPEDDTRNIQLLEDVYQSLVNPGPDLVICDEGHRIKNCNASTSSALKSIRTRRRVVLTGYPLQNNLLEYWCMVDFVRPSYLGTRSEFCNMFERPIQNGQCLDSTPKDRQLMRFRAHVLHSLLQGFVQRRGHAVLRDVLPRKEEHVLLIRMTPIQRTLYKEFVKEFLHNYRVANPLKFFAVCCKVWNHPDILYNLVQDKKNEGSLDIDLDIDLVGPAAKDCKKAPAGPADSVVADPGTAPESNGLIGLSPQEAAEAASITSKLPKYMQEPGFVPFRDRSDNTISYEWAYPLLEKYMPGLLENSHKFQVLMTMIDQILGVGDKLLVFSQSLSTLDLVERFLNRREVPLRPGLSHGDKWARGRNYFRLDGSTSAQEREKLINEYNGNPCVSLFLLSTRAGCLGINLTGANRIVVLDASWNPCHDAQAVCRIYRYGQTKPCHIYRLVCDNCLEKRIYDRQINKQGMSDRVVDEMNPEANLTWKDVSTLVQDNEDDPPVPNLAHLAGNYTDSVLRTLTVEYAHCLTREPFEHESLLLDRKDMKLTKFEKRLARQSYELAKRASLQGGRALTANFAAHTNGYQTWQNRPGNVTFVAPTKMTPSPMRPLDGNVMQALLRQGMTVQRMRIPAKVTIPLKDSDDPPVEIAPGTEILVMKTPRGVFLQVPDGRIIAVRIPLNETLPVGQTGEGTSSGSSNKQSFGVVQPSLQCGGRVQLSSARQNEKAPEVINLDDDSADDSDESKGGNPKEEATIRETLPTVAP